MKLVPSPALHSLLAVWLALGPQAPAVAHTGQSKPVAELRCESWGNHLYVDVRVNGKGPYPFLFDTGAGATMIEKSRAAEIGLRQFGTAAASGAGAASIAAAIYPSATLSAGGLSSSPITVYGIPLDSISRMSGRAVDGILGHDFFGKYVVEIDYPGKVVRLYRPEDFSYSGPGETLPFELVVNHIRIRAKVARTGREGVEGRFIVDTGATGSLGLSGQFVADNDLMTETQKKMPLVPVGAGVGGNVMGRLSRTESLTIGTMTVATPVTIFTNDSKGIYAVPNLAGLIGYGVLKRFTLIVNYPGKKITFEKNAHFADADEEGSTGLRVEATPPDYRKYRVLDVWPGAPADAAGLKAGDEIQEVAGKPAKEYSMPQLRELFRKTGSRIPVTVSRGGETVRAVVVVTEIK
jgi:predicted aspartyl protease